VRVGVAGGTLGVQTAMNDLVVREKALNVAQVAFIIVVLSALAMRSLVAGFLVLVPLGLAVTVALGIMGWANIWLDMTTAAFTAMGVSIGADFAIYLIFRVREEVRAGQNLHAAVLIALRTSGKAILFVSSAVAFGYLVLPLSGFSIWRRLGVLTATLIGSSALGSVTILPSLLLVLRPRFLTSAAHDRVGIDSAVAVAGDQHVAELPFARLTDQE
jgi:predicted RND superfamily exporter protein